MDTLKHLNVIKNNQKEANNQHRRLLRKTRLNLGKNIQENYPVKFTDYRVNGTYSKEPPEDQKVAKKAKTTITSHIFSFNEFKDQYTIASKSNADSTNSSASTDDGVDWKASYDSAKTEFSSASSAQANLQVQLDDANNKLNDVEVKVPTTDWKIKYDSLANEQNNQLAIANSKASSNSTNAYNLTKACQSKDDVINSLKANPANNNNELMKSQNDKLSKDNTILSETLNTNERIITDIYEKVNGVMLGKKNPESPKELASGIKGVIDLNRKMEKSTKQVNNQDDFNNPDK